MFNGTILNEVVSKDWVKIQHTKITNCELPSQFSHLVSYNNTFTVSLDSDSPLKRCHMPKFTTSIYNCRKQ
jgi:hypothetical protein